MKTLKLFFTFTLVLAMSGTLFSQGIAINISGTDPDPSAVLDVSATNMGVLIPRLSTEERDKITSDAGVTGYTGYDPEESLLIYNTDRCCFEFYANSSWHGMGCECGKVTFTYDDLIVTYGTVRSKGCKCWLDRNLGASQVATSSTDHQAYGDLFQWGRLADGHQLITWTAWDAGTPDNGTTATLSPSDTPGHVNFITNGSSPFDWRDDNNDNRWNATPMVNNPCPSGWRVPTNTELNAERLSWSSLDSAGAIASPLKLPLAGFRLVSNGSLSDVGSYGYYWSSTVSASNSRSLAFSSSSALMSTRYRAFGFSVRCIKD